MNLQHSSDEESQQTQSNSNAPPQVLNVQNGEDCNHSSTDIDQSDSFLRDTMLEQQNLNEKKQAKRGNN